MDTKRHIFTAIAAVLMVGTMAMPAHAKPAKWKNHQAQKTAFQAQKTYRLPVQPMNVQPYRSTVQAPLLFAQSNISAAKAKSIAQKHVKDGEAVDVTLKGDTYRVRVIVKGGKVVDVFIDAKSGRVKK